MGLGKIMLHDFFYYQNLYTKDECNTILQFAKQNVTKEYYDIAPDFKNTKTELIRTIVIENLLEKFFERVYDTNNKYFGFSLFSKKPSTVNLNTYDVNSSYDIHKDSSENGQTSDIKLTTILNLSNEPYTGGEFELLFGNMTMHIPQLDNTGSILIFPSFHYHRVKPVTSGKRISLSVWFAGPNWK